MQNEVSSLRTRFGQPLTQPKRLGTKANDMSQAGLQILQLDLDNLHAERAQRERKLDMLLGRLRKACIELDEDDSAAAAAAHPSLQHHRCTIANIVWQDLLTCPCLNSSAAPSKDYAFLCQGWHIVD